ncbi:MAG: CBS domain-containing protein [Candidatus Omnitrophica bacterium]|nr:CBS domain-containing protein [Candidatus Omnitrophota bacterium]MCA9437535.1 CBS domain-containing protein [Candidatus Omnitrophota bacterium]MCA9441240.1 CBS domain-containing protein [Candidatus Omnitrophota bacterium]
MQVKELMTHSIESIAAAANLHEAAKKMEEQDVGALPVIDHGKVVGILTDRDIAIRAVAKNCVPSETTVSEVMTTGDLELLSAESEISEAATTMAGKQIRRILVTNDQEEIVGILSLGDLAAHAQNPKLIGMILEKVSEEHSPH